MLRLRFLNENLNQNSQNNKNVKCCHGPFMLPKATGKIFLTITCVHSHFQLCLLGSENSEFGV